MRLRPEGPGLYSPLPLADHITSDNLFTSLSFALLDWQRAGETDPTFTPKAFLAASSQHVVPTVHSWDPEA